MSKPLAYLLQTLCVPYPVLMTDKSLILEGGYINV